MIHASTSVTHSRRADAPASARHLVRALGREGAELIAARHMNSFATRAQLSRTTSDPHHEHLTRATRWHHIWKLIRGEQHDR